MVVGITGGLATGKSLVTRTLQDKGAITFSADQAARSVLTIGGPLLAEISREFGSDVLHKNGELDRKRLGQIAFTDMAALAKLNGMMHPAILRLLRAQIEATLWDFSYTVPVVIEIPLLFETNLANWFELIVVVSASESTQIARLQARNGFDEVQARFRLAAQMPVSEKAARADRVIVNEGSLEELSESVDSLWKELMQTARAKARKKKCCFLPGIML